MSYNNLRKGRFNQNGQIYHITTITHHRIPYFKNLATGRKLVQELIRLDQQGYSQTLCYVIMPDHLHWLMELRNASLATIVQLLKGRSARAIGGRVWQANYYDHAIRHEENIQQLARYIIANPLRKNLVEKIGDYSLWDAVWLDKTLSA